MVTEFPVALPFVEMIGEYADDKIKPLVTVNDDNVPDPTIRSKLSVVMTVPSTFGIVIVRSCVGSTIAILYKADEDGIVNLNAAAFCIVPTNVVDPPKLVAPLKTFRNKIQKAKAENAKSRLDEDQLKYIAEVCQEASNFEEIYAELYESAVSEKYSIARKTKAQKFLRSVVRQKVNTIRSKKANAKLLADNAIRIEHRLSLRKQRFPRALASETLNKRNKSHEERLRERLKSQSQIPKFPMAPDPSNNNFKREPFRLKPKVQPMRRKRGGDTPGLKDYVNADYSKAFGVCSAALQQR